MGALGRRAALVPDLYDFGRSHIRAAAELAYSLSLDLGSTDHQAFELIARAPDGNAFIRELEHIEFDAECAESLPDGARLTALCTSILEREGTLLDEVITVCRAFDRAASNPGVVLPDHGAIQVYARFADALLDHGQCREAKTAIEFVQEAAGRIGPLMYRDARSHATHRAIIRTKENAARLS